MNSIRLERLKVKIDCVNSVFEEARIHLLEKIKNKPEEYKNVMKNLIIQGLIKLLEDEVNIICKKEDYDLVCSIVNQAKEEFLIKLKSESKKYQAFNTEITVDTKYHLPEAM
jgi:V-type H+-transporting ATPase subunit E